MSGKHRRLPIKKRVKQKPFPSAEVKKLFLSNPYISNTEIARMIGETPLRVTNTLYALRRKDPEIQKVCAILKAEKQARRDALKNSIVEKIRSGSVESQQKMARTLGITPLYLTSLLQEIASAGSPSDKKTVETFFAEKSKNQPARATPGQRRRQLAEEFSKANKRFSRLKTSQISQLIETLEKKISQTPQTEKRDLLQMRLNAARAFLRQRKS